MVVIGAERKRNLVASKYSRWCHPAALLAGALYKPHTAQKFGEWGTPCQPPNHECDRLISVQRNGVDFSYAHSPILTTNKGEVLMEIITNDKLDELLAASPAERVTPEYIKSRIIDTQFTRVTDTMTHCRITLDNGYGVSGESACVNVENYKQEIGEKISYVNAFRQLWPLFGFLLAEKNKLMKAVAA